MIEIEDFKKYVSYNPDTGTFTRIAVLNDNPSHQWRVGDTVGNQSSNGYIEVSVGDIKFQAHKLAWYFVHGVYPDFYLDHVNGDKTDNRIENLRESSPLINMRNRGKNKNNSTGFNGVYVAASGRFRARIKINGKLINIGTFDTAEEASEARELANEFYGFSEDHGKRDSW